MNSVERTHRSTNGKQDDLASMLNETFGSVLNVVSLGSPTQHEDSNTLSLLRGNPLNPRQTSLISLILKTHQNVLAVLAVLL